MDRLRNGLNNQAIGIFPLLLAMFVHNYTSYMTAFIWGISFCLVGIILYYVIWRDKVYQFLLLPTTVTLVLFSTCFLFNIKGSLSQFAPLIAEIFFVVVLAIYGFTRRSVLRHIRNSNMPAFKRTYVRNTLNESYFVAQIIQNLYTLHVFFIFIYSNLPDSIRHEGLEAFLYNHLGWLIGLLVIIYSQIRTFMLNGNLKKEVWLPVLNDKGRVIGSMARSVSRSSDRKFFHPIVRVAVIYNGMLYLVKRNSDEYVSPDLLDYPLHKYVLFRDKIEDTLEEVIAPLNKDKLVTPRFLIRYTFENDVAKHLVSLYAVCVNSEDQLTRFAGGKLWTANQIEDNIGAGIYSEYFEKEFPYLQNTVLLAESICNCNGQITSVS